MLKTELQMAIFILYACGYLTDNIDSRPKLILVFLLDIDKKGLISSGDRMAGAVMKSVLQAQEILPEFDLSEWEIIDSACDATITTRRLLNLWNRLDANGKRIHGVIGPYCVGCCKIASTFCSSYNIPVISHGCFFKEAGLQKWYPTLTRVNGDIGDAAATILGNLVIQKSIKRLMILVTQDVHTDSDLAYNIDELMGKFVGPDYDYKMIRISSKALWDADPGIIVADLIHNLLSLKRKGYEVIFLAMANSDTKYVLQTAFSIGMMDGTTVFVANRYIFLEGLDRPHRPDLDENLMLAENGLLVLNFAEPESADYRAFMQEITDIDKHFDDPRLQKFKPKRSFTVEQLHIGAALVYDAVTLWAKGLRKALEYSWPGDGRFIVKNIYTITFPGLTGQIDLDDKRSRRLDWVLHVVQNNGTLVKVGDYEDKEQKLTINHTALKSITWANGVKEMPGIDLKKSTFLDVLIAIACAMGVVVIGLVVLCLYCRKFRIDMEAERTMAWLIHWEDIKITVRSKDKSDATSRATSVSHHSASSGSYHMMESRSFDSFPAGGLAEYGYYHEKKIVIKFSQMATLDMRDYKIRMEFIKIRKIHHVNINDFVGACVEPTHVCICMSYCPKGSVWNVIERRSFSMTWHFRMALAVDIAKGMTYLHESKIGSHGHLTSTNCVIDSRWTCKITDYGLCHMRRTHLSQQQLHRQRLTSRMGNIHQDDDSDDDIYYLWTAPEILRLNPQKRPLCGTKNADVYSYGIILQEICFQQKPFGIFLEEFDATEVVSRVKRAEKPPFRPIEPEDKAEMAGDTTRYSSKWMDLMKLCWAEKPSERTSFRNILLTLQRISGGQVIHAIDNMVKMLEIHTVRLENIVHSRSQELYEQKQKADSLLYSILPKVVAEQLKQGGRVLPEYFEAVTIFVSDIVKFTPLAAASTPIQVVNFLGLLYNMFDEIIDRNDVYKVETVGDAYIVASGLPTRNGNAHASEIATFALQLLSSILKFTIPHLPEKVLEVRIGIHTGPVLAGVVGQKMPRYCLFGDTVNTTNIMEASSLPNSIHVSDTTYKILSEIGIFRLTEYRKIDYEAKQDMQTYRLLGKISKRSSTPEFHARRASFSGRLPSFQVPPSDLPTPAASIDVTTRRPSLIDRLLNFANRRPSLPGSIT